MGDGEQGDPDGEAILRRRNRLVAIALSGVAATSLGACEPCLTPIAPDAGRWDAGIDASPVPCLSDAGRPRPDAGSLDAGSLDADAEPDAEAGDAGPDAGPKPCLTAKA